MGGQYILHSMQHSNVWTRTTDKTTQDCQLVVSPSVSNLRVNERRTTPRLMSVLEQLRHYFSYDGQHGEQHINQRQHTTTLHWLVGSANWIRPFILQYTMSNLVFLQMTQPKQKSTTSKMSFIIVFVNLKLQQYLFMWHTFKSVTYLWKCNEIQSCFDLKNIVSGLVTLESETAFCFVLNE